MWQILQTSNSRWSRIQKTTSKYNGSWIKESASVGLYWTVTGLHIMPPNPHQFVFFNHSCLCNEACSCSPHQVISPGSEYVNRQRSWSNGSSHSLQTPKLKSQQKAGTSAPPTPLNLSPCLTPNLSRNGSKLSSILGVTSTKRKVMTSVSLWQMPSQAKAPVLGVGLIKEQAATCGRQILSQLPSKSRTPQRKDLQLQVRILV